MHLVKVASPSEAPHEGIILYFPRINHDMFCVPMESVENIITELEEKFCKTFDMLSALPTRLFTLFKKSLLSLKVAPRVRTRRR